MFKIIIQKKVSFFMFMFWCVLVYIVLNKEDKKNSMSCVNNSTSKHNLIIKKMQWTKSYVVDERNDLKERDTQTRHILMWTNKTTVPFVYLEQGNSIFVKKQCKFSNCYITDNKTYLPRLTIWDAIIFHVPEWYDGILKEPPRERSPNQIYIFTSIESSHYYPVDPRQPYNSFFNLTWTYRIDSDIRWGYVFITNMKGEIIGPKHKMKWHNNMAATTDDVKHKLKQKNKAAAWIVSNCNSISEREKFALELNANLAHYNLSVDIYGKCGNFTCDSEEECYTLLTKNYYFYLSLENSFAKDYVTEKLLHALKNYAVPIVWGGADYNRFLPPGSYIDGFAMNNTKKVAEMMHSLINNQTEYAAYFKWRNYYKYQRDTDTPDTEASCLLCEAMNNQNRKQKVYDDIRAWWNK